MVKTEEMCIGSCGCDCDSRCTNYGNSRKVLICDECGSETDELICYGDDQICEDCLQLMFEIYDGPCSECGYDTDLYDYDGELLCLDCLKERFAILTEEDM